jgi:hypothetical protein
MAEILLPVGLRKQAEADLDWESSLDAGFDDADTRLTATFAGDPNLSVAGHWVGQACWDSTAEKMWYCTVATGGAIDSVWKDSKVIIEGMSFATLTTVLLTTTGLATLDSAQVNNVLQVLGQLQADGGIVLPSGKKVTGEADQSWLSDGAGSMNPILHGVRHQRSGADPISGVIGGPYMDYDQHAVGATSNWLSVSITTQEDDARILFLYGGAPDSAAGQLSLQEADGEIDLLDWLAQDEFQLKPFLHTVATQGTYVYDVDSNEEFHHGMLLAFDLGIA